MFHLRWTKPKVNNYNPLTRVIRSTIITCWLRSYNINYHNPLIKAGYVNNYNPLIRSIKMSTIITRWLGPYNITYYNLLIMTENFNNYNLLTKAIETRIKHFILLIQTHKTKFHISTIMFFFHKQRKWSNIFPMQHRN